MNAKYLIEKLQLLRHPEGGWYRETYRSTETTLNKMGAIRNVCTAIYFMLEGNDKSHFHRIQSDEAWFFHSGEPMEILMLNNNQLRTITLGNDILNEQVLQFVIPAQTWFAAKIKTGSGYSLVSCSVAPGFDFSDFELANREELSGIFPEYSDVINEFTTG